ncbi:MAG: hypothetical protein ACRYFU_08965 [Janthinobacterium lividum]
MTDMQSIQRLGWKLSANAFQGRFFFPNILRTEGNKSLRPRVLDWLVFAFKVCCTVRTSGDSQAANAIFQLQRGFTIDMQLALDPADLDSPLVSFQEKLHSKDGFMEFSQSDPALIQAKDLIKSRESVAT